MTEAEFESKFERFDSLITINGITINYDWYEIKNNVVYFYDEGGHNLIASVNLQNINNI